MIGDTLGHYQILEKLGSGGMGEVFKARDTRLHRFVAIKVLRSDRLSGDSRRQRFFQEAQAASALNHPNIVTIHDIGQHNGVDYMVMEFIDGRTLDAHIPRQGMPLGDALQIAAQVAEGLRRAHAAAIVHRDLKPSNIIVSKEGHVKILDFGLAKLIEPDQEGDASTVTNLPLTEEGTILGTAAYMSPEQASGRKLDTRTDVFSFGAVLYEMLAGHRAFSGDSRISTLSAVLRDEPKPLENLPTELDRILRRCLRKDPEKRFQHMDDLRVALLEIKEESESGRLTPAVDVPVRRRNWLPIAAGVGVLLLIGAGIWLWTTRASLRAVMPEAVVTQLTRDAGYTTDPAVSPDGKLLAYASDRGGDGNVDIWVQQMAGGQPVRLTRHPAVDQAPQFSPDGTTIFFASSRDGGGLFSVPTLGGDERRITKGSVVRPVLSPDGAWLTYGVGGYMGETVPCYLVPASGGSPQRVHTSLPTFRAVAWTRDNKTLLGWGRDAPAPSGQSVGDEQIYAVPAEGGKATLVTLEDGKSFSRNRFPRFRLVGNRLLFSSRGAIDEYLVDPGTWKLRGPIRRLVSFPGSSLDFAVSGQTIVVSSARQVQDIWNIPLDGNRGVRTGAPEKLTNDEASDWEPSLSSDGSKLVFTSDRSGNRDIWLRDMATGKDTQVTATPEIESRARISPDGSKVLYEVDGKSILIFVRESVGGEAKLVCRGCGNPTWTPDSLHAIYFDGNPIRYHRQNLGTGENTELIAHPRFGIHSARLSPDGHWVSFHMPQGEGRSRYYVAPVRNGRAAPESEWVPVTDLDRTYTLNSWSPDGNLLYLLRRTEGSEIIVAQPLDRASKRPKGPLLTVFEPPPGLAFNGTRAGFTISKDRLVVSMVQSKANLWKVEEAAPKH